MDLNLKRSGPWIGAGGLAVLLWLSFISFLFAPAWGVVLLICLLVPQVMLLARWARTRPTWCPWIPTAGVAVWFGVCLVGAHWWGWAF